MNVICLPLLFVARTTAVRRWANQGVKKRWSHDEGNKKVLLQVDTVPDTKNGNCVRGPFFALSRSFSRPLGSSCGDRASALSLQAKAISRFRKRERRCRTQAASLFTVLSTSSFTAQVSPLRLCCLCSLFGLPDCRGHRVQIFWSQFVPCSGTLAASLPPPHLLLAQLREILPHSFFPRCSSQVRQHGHFPFWQSGDPQRCCPGRRLALAFCRL